MIQRVRGLASPVTSEIKEIGAKAAAALQLNALTGIFKSFQVSTPMVVGLLKPVIIVPASVLAGIDAWDLEVILRHELAHIKRKDHLINWVQTILENMLFFNPFIWLISGIIRKERELACDQMVIRTGVDGLDYAEVLMATATVQQPNFNLQIGFAGERRRDLLNRIKKIFSTMETKKNGNLQAAAFVLLLVLVGFVAVSGKFERSIRYDGFAKPVSLSDANVFNQKDIFLSEAGMATLKLVPAIRYELDKSISSGQIEEMLRGMPIPIILDTVPELDIRETLEEMEQVMEQNAKQLHEFSLQMKEMTEALQNDADDLPRHRTSL